MTTAHQQGRKLPFKPDFLPFLGHIGPWMVGRCHSISSNLGSVQNLFGSRAGFIDRGADTFFERKNGGQELFFSQKKGGRSFFHLEKRGATTFFRRKKGGQEFFL